MAGRSLPPRCRRNEVRSVLEKAGFKNEDPENREGRKTLQEVTLALKAEKPFNTEKHVVLFGLEELYFEYDGHRLRAGEYCTLISMNTSE